MLRRPLKFAPPSRGHFELTSRATSHPCELFAVEARHSRTEMSLDCRSSVICSVIRPYLRVGNQKKSEHVSLEALHFPGPTKTCQIRQVRPTQCRRDIRSLWNLPSGTLTHSAFFTRTTHHDQGNGARKVGIVPRTGTTFRLAKFSTFSPHRKERTFEVPRAKKGVTPPYLKAGGRR